MTFCYVYLFAASSSSFAAVEGIVTDNSWLVIAGDDITHSVLTSRTTWYYPSSNNNMDVGLGVRAERSCTAVVSWS